MKQQHKTETDYNYCGITIHAALGLHEFAIDVILNKCKPNAHILDLGCGSGAFTKRLQNHGYKTTSVDLSLDTFSLQTEQYEIDLHSNFSEQLSGHEFDAIVALEVLEHLENPLHFLRQLKLIAGSETVILVSFPNLYLYSGIRSFYKNATFGNFSPYLYWETGHQTIIPDWLFEEHLKKVGLTQKEKMFCAPVNFPQSIIKKIVRNIFFKAICLFNKDITHEARISECVLFVLKNESDISEELKQLER